MPKRVVDGEALWGSDKLAKVEPAWIRPEFANLLPLALANGVFEANPQRVWTKVYAYNRPDVTPQKVAEVLAEFERVKLLFRWTDRATGKAWGYWVGIEKPGRLPGISRRGKNEAIGPEPPAEGLRKFIGIAVGSAGVHMEANGIYPIPNGSEPNPNGNNSLLGFGSGSGIGSGSGATPVPEEQLEHRACLNVDRIVEEIVRAYPNVASRLGNRMLPSSYERVVVSAISRECEAQQISENEAGRFLLHRTQRFTEIVTKWPKDQHRFIPSLERFFGEECMYNDAEERWERNETVSLREAETAPMNAIKARYRSLGLNDDGTKKEQTA